MGRGNRVLFLIITVVLFSTIGVFQDSFAITDAQIKEMLKINDSTTKPTFGPSHETNRKIVDYGFSFNDKKFKITDNFHTPFPEQPIKVGEVNNFEAKVFAEHGLKVQEFIFGIPQKGEAHLGELSIEIWYDVLGQVEQINVVQNSEVIDTQSLEVVHEKSKCTSRDSKNSCDSTKISMVFFEPLQDKVMAIKAIDNLNRYQITYLNEGFDVSGDSLSEMPSMMIPSNIRDQGLIKITKTAKYSPIWVAEDGRVFEQNKFGSFTQTNIEFERFQDSGEPRSRLHSGFVDLMKSEQERASEIFDGSKLIKELPSSQAAPEIEIKERITKELKAKMLEIEKECLEYLKKTNKQTRNY